MIPDINKILKFDDLENYEVSKNCQFLEIFVDVLSHFSQILSTVIFVLLYNFISMLYLLNF